MTSNSEASAKSPPAKLALRNIGKYELQRQLGAGGMGAVYLAKDTQLKRLVALKVLPEDKAKNSTLVRRFMSEAQASAQLRHNHIVAVYENGEADGHLFIAMEYVDGTDLHELIRKRGKIPAKRALEIVKQVADALQHAYENNIVHRDIKPSNLLIRNDGLVKLTDLGLARSIDDTLETDITRAGTTVGTVDYMSPEQGRSSKAADVRSDLYSLGCTWYHMLTGKPPYPEGSLTNKLQAHATKPIPNPHDLNEHVTEGTVAVIQRMMAKKPEDRYQTPAELLKDLSSPSLTRGGVVQEMLTAINEDTSEAVDIPKTSRRGGLPAGTLPPKKNAKPVAASEEEKESIIDWETLQPLLWGAVLLTAIAVLGSVVAYFSGGFDFGSGGRMARQARDPHLKQGANNVIQSPQTGAAPGQTDQPPPDFQPGVQVVNSPESINSPDGTQPGTDGTGNPQTITSPGTITSPNSGDPSNPGNYSPSTITSPGGVAQAPRSFDADEIPEWSNTPSLRAQAKGGAIPNAPNSPNNSSPNNSNPKNSTSNNPTPNAPTPNNPSANNPKPNTPTNPNNPRPGTPTNPSNPGTGTKPPGTAPSPGSAPVAVSKNFTVGPGATSANHFRTLAEALKSLPPEGGVIRLTDRGPYSLPQISLRQVKSVILLAEDGQQPMVIVRPAPGELTAGLELAEGVLAMEGLHFVLDRSVFVGSDPVRMVTSIDGQLLVRQCSFSIWGTGSVPVCAMEVDSRRESQGISSALPPQVLLDQVLVKGDHVTALAVARPTADVVIRESLLASGQLPVISLSGKIPELLAGSSIDKPRRALRILQSTLFANKTVFEVSAEGAKTPPATAVLLQESVCATSGPPAETTLLNAAEWPEAKTDSLAGKLANLSWTMKESAAFGFGRLAELGPDSTVQAKQLEGWQTLWNKKYDAGLFPATTWPDQGLSDLSAASVKTFDRAALPNTEARRADSSPVGCDVTLLADLSTGSRQWLMAVSAKPVFPAVVAPANPPAPVKLDISKQQDLGTMLQNGTWPAGTVLEVVGAGVKQMTPVKLVNKSWKIIWSPQEGGPLTLAPRVSNDLPALIVVERGSLELENLRFQVQASKKSSIKSLIAAQGARLTLENVWLQGLMSDNNTLESLLSWNGGASAADGPLPYLACRDSIFSGSDSLIRLDMGAAPAFLKNCLLVSRGDGLDVRFQPLPAGQSPGALVADHLTVSAANGAIRLQSASAETGLPAHRFYVDRCVFAPPMSVKGEEKVPTIFSLHNPVTDLTRVEWWGIANGFAPEIPSTIRGEREAKANQPGAGLSRWQAAWGNDQDVRLLTGPGGILMADQSSGKSTAIKPSQFALHQKSKAMTWDEGLPIGADLAQLELPAPAPKSKDPKAPQTPNKPPAQADF